MLSNLPERHAPENGLIEVDVSEVFQIREPDPRSLTKERDRVTTAIRGELPFADVHEVGSTAIAGVIGKGDLDFVVLVPAARFEAARSALDGRYPRNPRQYSGPIYQGYLAPSPLFDIALQVTVRGGPHDVFDLFLAALRANPDRIRDYNALKRAWNGLDMEGYRRAKAAFIEMVLADERMRAKKSGLSMD